jgi:PAS domain S-box-containing protein
MIGEPPEVAASGQPPEELDYAALLASQTRLREQVALLEARLRKRDAQRRAMLHIMADLHDLNHAAALRRKAMIHILSDYDQLLHETQEVVRARDQALAEAAAERDRLQQVVDVLPIGILIVDASGQLVISNRAAAELMGLELAGQPRLVSEETASEVDGVRRLDGSPYPAHELPLRRALLRGEVVRGEPSLVHNVREGRDIPVLINSAPLRDTGGALTGAVVAFQDISTIKDLERTRDEFLSAITHDLKTPLTVVRGQAQLMQRRLAHTPDGARLAARLTGIVEATTSMTALIDELLDVARLEMGQPLMLDCRPTDLVGLARRVVKQVQAGRRHRLHIDAAAPELVGEWEAARLERVVANLISNAIKYSPQGGEITVRVAADDDAAGHWAVLTVSDQGVGIPRADLPHIFEGFHRAGNVAGQIAGTGLGLASARQIVEQHGGTISVESQEGVGSTFTVRLPLAPIVLGAAATC